MHLFVKQKSESVPSFGLYDIEKDEGEEDDEASSQEGNFIASEIQKLVGRAKGDGKYIGYGDIAVLFRSRSTGAKEIVKTLKSKGIPVNEGAFGKSVSLPERELVAFCACSTIPDKTFLSQDICCPISAATTRAKLR